MLLLSEPGIHHHRQCFSTCYFESAISGFEIQLRNLYQDPFITVLRVPARLAILEKRGAAVLNPLAQPTHYERGPFRYIVENGSLEYFKELRRGWLQSIRIPSHELLPLREFENQILQRMESEINSTIQQSRPEEQPDLLFKITRKYHHQIKTGQLYETSAPPRVHHIRLSWRTYNPQPRPTARMVIETLSEELDSGHAPVVHQVVRPSDLKSKQVVPYTETASNFFTVDRKTIQIIAYHGLTLVGMETNGGGNVTGFIAKDSSRNIIKTDRLGTLRVIPIDELTTIYDSHHVPIIEPRHHP